MKDITIDAPFYLQIQREINQIQSKASTYNGFFYAIRILQILITGTITVLSGLHTKTVDYTSIILVLGTTVTALIAIDTLFGVGSKRNTYKLILFELKAIRSEFVFGIISKNIDPGFLPSLFQKYEKATSLARDLIGSDSQPPVPTPAPKPDPPPVVPEVIIPAVIVAPPVVTTPKDKG